jgi:glucosamine 6-phosphate synthetase-like amidotransferase/phosphosugar isomerase protein
VIAAGGAAIDRTRDVLRALRIIGAKLLVVGDERVVHGLSESGANAEANEIVTFEPVLEQLSPILAVIPLQLLAEFTADLRGADADIFRADDPVYKAANQSYIL